MKKISKTVFSNQCNKSNSSENAMKLHHSLLLDNPKRITVTSWELSERERSVVGYRPGQLKPPISSLRKGIATCLDCMTSCGQLAHAACRCLFQKIIQQSLLHPRALFIYFERSRDYKLVPLALLFTHTQIFIITVIKLSGVLLIFTHRVVSRDPLLFCHLLLLARGAREAAYFASQILFFSFVVLFLIRFVFC